jgi:steroid delta-isomerase
VRSGDWQLFSTNFTEDAIMRFVGVPAGPFLGRDAIARAYLAQPPTDTMTVSDIVNAGEVDTVEFAWSAGEGGVMRMSWRGHLICDLEVAFDR